MRDLRKRLVSVLWASDPGLTALLVVLVFTLFVAPALLSTGTVSRLMFGAFFTLLLLSGVASVLAQKRARWVVGALAIAAFLAQWTSIAWPSRGASMVEGVLVLVTCSVLALLVLARVFGKGPITVHRVMGSVVVYLLFGLIWTQAYFLVELYNPAAFTGLGSSHDPVITRQTLGYYSYVTLTTLGYGDIIPVLPAARGLATLEALVGQLFPAILIARLVSMQIMSRDRS